MRQKRTLSWSLAVLGCLGVTSLYGARLMAQTRGPGAATSAAASQAFLAFVANRQTTPDITQQLNLVAQQNLDVLGSNGVTRLATELCREFIVSHWQTQATVNDKGDSAVVEFKTATPPDKPVVCVHEAGGWRVDLMATYARWNDLDEKASLVKISALTATIIPGVPIDPATANTVCRSNLKQINLGLMMYVQDYDETFPPANKWRDVIQPYMKDEDIYHCPLVTKNQSGYAMNWQFSRKVMADVAAPAQTVDFYETNILRRNANGDGKNLALRHLMGANYAFADGHVKWAKQGIPQEFRLAPPATKR